MTPWLPDGAREWGGRPVARSAAEALPRRRAVVTGVVRRVRSRTGPGGARFEAELEDATGCVTVCWDGREMVAGVEPGISLAVEGTVGQQRGRRVLRNPLYRFSDPPAASSSASW